MTAPKQTRRAMVTGANGGIGSALAKRLAAEGWFITAVGREETTLLSVLQALPGSGHEVLVADLTNEAGQQAVAACLIKTHHSLLINNAGFGLYGAFESIPLAKQRQMIRLNCEALTALSYGYLVSAKPGDMLLNVASTLGFTSFPNGAVYAATKAFVIALSEALWFEQRGRGVHVAALCPGATRTPFHSSAGGSDDAFPAYVFQTPEQVADTAMKAIRGGAPSRISGFINGMLVWSGRLVPRTWVIRMMGAVPPKMASEPAKPMPTR